MGKKVKNVSPSLHNAMSATEGLVRTLGDRAKAFKAFSVGLQGMPGTEDRGGMERLCWSTMCAGAAGR